MRLVRRGWDSRDCWDHWDWVSRDCWDHWHWDSRDSWDSWDHWDDRDRWDRRDGRGRWDGWFGPFAAPPLAVVRPRALPRTGFGVVRSCHAVIAHPRPHPEVDLARVSKDKVGQMPLVVGPTLSGRGRPRRLTTLIE